MATKEQIIQEIEQAPEHLLKEILEFIRSRKKSQVDPMEAYLNQLLAAGEYADDASPEELAAHDAAAKDYLEGRDHGLTAEELQAEFELQSWVSGAIPYKHRQFVT